MIIIQRNCIPMKETVNINLLKSWAQSLVFYVFFLLLLTTLRSRIDGCVLIDEVSKKFIKSNKREVGIIGRGRGGLDLYYFYDQNLVICYKICLQTCFTNFWKGKLLKIRKQSFHMQNKFSLLFLEILTNTNTNKCCQTFLTFLKRY